MAEAVMGRLEELGVGVWAGLGGRVTRSKSIICHENVKKSRLYEKTRTCRGVHWKGGESDGGGEGTVTRAETSGLVAVKWDVGNFGFYRFRILTISTFYFGIF